MKEASGWEATNRSRIPAVGVFLVLVLSLSALISLSLGPARLAPIDVAMSLLSRVGWAADPLSQIDSGIIWQLRLPRILAAIAVGAGLSVCGCVMQTLTRNALADPYLLGLSSGASLGAVVTLSLGLVEWLPIAAFVGALVALVCVLSLAHSAAGESSTRTTLAGVAVGQICAAATSFVILWAAAGDAYREILSWLLGSVAGITLNEVGLLWVFVIPALLLIVLLSRPLDAFIFGDDMAHSVGVNPSRLRWLLLVVVAVLVGVLVAFAGSIGFVGLLIPHAVRWLLRTSRHAVVLPIAALVGALFMLLADTLARTIFSPQEVPVGVVTALLGVPLFIVLLRREGTYR